MVIIEEEERLGWQRMQPRLNLTRLLHSLRSARIRTALATRNTKESYQIFAEKAALESATDDALVLKPAVFRDSLNGINKPDAQVRSTACTVGLCIARTVMILTQVAEHIMAQWDILPSQRDRVWFVGDSKDDMLCGAYSNIARLLLLLQYHHLLPLVLPLLISPVQILLTMLLIRSCCRLPYLSDPYRLQSRLPVRLGRSRSG